MTGGGAVKANNFMMESQVASSGVGSPVMPPSILRAQV